MGAVRFSYAYDCWSGGDRDERQDLVSIPIATSNYDKAFNRGCRGNWVTVATFIIIERFCAFAILGDGTTGARETGKRKHCHHPRKQGEPGDHCDPTIQGC